MVKKKNVEYRSFVEDGVRYMICRNSKPKGKYWTGILCTDYTSVGEDTTAVLCYKCVNRVTEPPNVTPRYKPTGRPPGWQWMKEFVDKDGTVYHKGKEQPKLKGTLKPTEVKSKKKKRKTKREREAEKRTDMSQLYDLKKRLLKAKLKKDQKALQTQINKINRKYIPSKKKKKKKK